MMEVPFFRPSIGEEEIAEVVDSLRRGWLTTGPKTKAFEEDFAAYLGGGVETVAVNSATAGLHLALEAVGVRDGDEVIVPTLTFTATAEVVRYLGAEPVLVDVDPATMNVSVEAIERAVTPRTKAIMPVHLGGLACDMTAIAEIAARHGLRIVDDAAHALPARHAGRLVGSAFADATVFSFYANKTITTGEGGMVATRDRDLAARCRVMRLHGIDRDSFDRFTSVTARWRYDVIAPGFKYNMTDLAAALGIHQLRKADAFRAERSRLARRYDEAFANLPLVPPPRASREEDHSRHIHIVRLADAAPIARDAFIERLQARGIGCSVHYTPLHMLTYWRQRYALAPEDFPTASSLFERSLTLPLFVGMTEVEQDHVIAAVRDILAGKN